MHPLIHLAGGGAHQGGKILVFPRKICRGNEIPRWRMGSSVERAFKVAKSLETNYIRREREREREREKEERRARNEKKKETEEKDEPGTSTRDEKLAVQSSNRTDPRNTSSFFERTILVCVQVNERFRVCY